MEMGSRRRFEVSCPELCMGKNCFAWQAASEAKRDWQIDGSSSGSPRVKEGAAQ